MTRESQTEFARRLNKDKAHVTRLKQAGRLVMAVDGLVEVEASLERIEATRGQRFDTERRWEEYRAHPADSAPPVQAKPAPTESPAPTQDAALSTDEISRRTRLAQMRKEEAEAQKRELELNELTADLLRRDAVEKALLDAVAVILSAGENLPDRLAPQLVGIEDMERVRARVKDEIEGFFVTISAELGRMHRSEDGEGVDRP